MPKTLTKDESSATDTYAKFVAEPFEAGYGHTLGNSLRRTLLSSIPGAAVTSIRADWLAAACMLSWAPSAQRLLALLPLPAVFCANTGGGSCRRLTPLPACSQQLQGSSGAAAAKKRGQKGP